MFLMYREHVFRCHRENGCGEKENDAGPGEGAACARECNRRDDEREDEGRYINGFEVRWNFKECGENSVYDPTRNDEDNCRKDYRNGTIRHDAEAAENRRDDDKRDKVI